MLTIILCILILMCVYNSKIIVEGATTGLMLWFYNVVPLLLPFMLISNLLVSRININNSSNKKAIFYTIFLGVFCGYPIGAFTTEKCVDSGFYSLKTGNILLPMCNNASPMFISGYIVHSRLQDFVSLPKAFTLIYLPYILYTACSFVLYSEHNRYQYVPSSKGTGEKNNSAKTLTDVIENICIIGVYIIICSIIMELMLYALDTLSAQQILNSNHTLFSKILISSVEITRGADLIGTLHISGKKIIALTLALTSFGGVSSILQTMQVIKASGLSIKKYISVKIICAMATYILTLIL